MSITALQVTTPPGVQPVSLVEAKRHLRVSSSAENANIKDLVAAATAWAERETRRRFIEQVVTLSMDRFPLSGESVITRGDVFENVFFMSTSGMQRSLDSRARDRSIFLPGGNCTAVESIAYLDELGAPQTLTGPTSAAPGTDYQEDLTDDEGAYLAPPDDSQWPAVDLGVMNAVVITFTLGYSSSGAGVPEDIKQAIKFRIGDLFNHRSSDGKGLDTTASDLLEPHRIQMF